MVQKSLFCILFLSCAAAAHAASEKPTKPGGERFEVSFPKEMSAAPLDGHVLLLLSNNDEK